MYKLVLNIWILLHFIYSFLHITIASTTSNNMDVIFMRIESPFYSPGPTAQKKALNCPKTPS